MPGAIADKQLVLQRQRFCDDGADATATEELCEGDKQIDGKDDEVAHGANRIMAGRANKTAPLGRIPSYC